MNCNPVVVVPVYKPGNDNDARISILHLKRHLGRYRTVLVKPESLDWNLDGAHTEIFPDENFSSVLNYNRLMLSPDFYNRFSNHSHVLVYQLDALVFRDDLEQWCNSEYDYIGASWYPDLIKRYTGNPWPFARIGAGNGGLSLRRTSAFLRHLQQHRNPLNAALQHLLRGQLDSAKRLLRFRRYINPNRFIFHPMLNEDVYLGVFAPLLDPQFSVAPPEVANRFSFEYDPKFLLAETNGALPFGCHAWQRFPDSREFWEPHLLGVASP